VSAGQVGTVYLLHFTSPYRHARHYRGWTSDLEARLAEHRAGRGARLIAVITAAGIGFVVAKTEPGTRRRERQLKQRGASRDCPVCIAARVMAVIAAERLAAGRMELAA
jgi:predicted GIY-YIG superfamily endonuclease